MNLDLSKKEWLLLSLAGFILIIGSLVAYYGYIQPLKDNVKLKENQLETEERLLAAVQGRLQSANRNTFHSTTELQQKLPVKPLVEQLILDFEKAEVISESFIVSIEFSESEAGLLSEPAASPESQAESSGETSVTPEASPEAITDVNAEPAVQAEVPVTAPTGLQKVVANLTVESADYYDLEKFIATLEGLKRVTTVEMIDFTGPKEIVSLADPTGPLSYKVIVAAYYMPELADLQNQLPKLDVPEPGNKRNPFNSFGNVTETLHSNLTRQP